MIKSGGDVVPLFKGIGEERIPPEKKYCRCSSTLCSRVPHMVFKLMYFELWLIINAICPSFKALRRIGGYWYNTAFHASSFVRILKFKWPRFDKCRYLGIYVRVSPCPNVTHMVKYLVTWLPCTLPHSYACLSNSYLWELEKLNHFTLSL